MILESSLCTLQILWDLIYLVLPALLLLYRERVELSALELGLHWRLGHSSLVFRSICPKTVIKILDHLLLLMHLSLQIFYFGRF